ncbi:hypothetical protein Tsubulata_047848 [Turnera subulata]|uniref:Small ribosomal subunit protein uS15c n=1 Tax=Turnera subulata TaxID=218843 RepID=A0A9Q0FXV4_9ROSI|nr:hypothetical protein Tsubulata_047848 [Turnera subulata]
MALILSRPKHRSLTNPSLFHLFSTSSSSSTPPSNEQPTPETASDSPPQSSTFSSYFGDVKASLKQQTPSNPQLQNHQVAQNFQSFRRPASVNPNPPSRVASLDEIRKNLSAFRRSTAAPPSLGSDPNSTTPSSPPQGQQQQQPQSFSFQEVYKRSVIARQDAAGRDPSGGRPRLGSPTADFDAIRASLKQMSRNPNNASPVLKPAVGETGGVKSAVVGGTEGLPSAVFGKEMKEWDRGDGKSDGSTDFVRMYSHEELGKKLRSLRPEVKGKGKEKVGFSLVEMNERLKKLRVLDSKEIDSISGLSFKSLRNSLVSIKEKSEEEAAKYSVQSLSILGRASDKDYMLEPPKPHLIEKYFHPDNMSSAEKMKIELAKVRDEFKMSESDCGSARVQVALLTMKIKHLSSVLHKKDKHSRKGLLGMVQKRKKLLKYLRRTDWDSYCLVLSRLGLRDNPDYKH